MKHDDKHSEGVALIAAERKRQVEKEGCTPEHDDDHTDASMATVAACFAAPDQIYTMNDLNGVCYEFEDPWPRSWHDAWDRRGTDTRIELLIKAGALIAAEIDRLKRLEKQTGGKS